MISKINFQRHTEMRSRILDHKASAEVLDGPGADASQSTDEQSQGMN
jgi:hypothetical protein